MPLDPADELLVAAANGLFSADDAIQQMHRAHTAAGGKTMSMSERNYQALVDARNDHIATLIEVPASSNAGIQAKAGRLAVAADGGGL